MQYLLFALLFIAILLEGTVTSLPLVLVVLIIMSVILQKIDVFLTAFIAGLLLDVFLVRSTALSSILFLCVLLLIFLYDRKYKIKSLFFVLPATLLSSLVYLFIFPSPNIFLQVVIATLLAGGVFSLIEFLDQKKLVRY